MPEKISGPKKSRLWVADVENPNVLSYKPKTFITQFFQNNHWENCAEFRNSIQK
jgi:hypothetical protein